MNIHEMYVTDEGVFGDAFGLCTFTTKHWTAGEWAAFLEADGSDRVAIAHEIDAAVWQRVSAEDQA